MERSDSRGPLGLTADIHSQRATGLGHSQHCTTLGPILAARRASQQLTRVSHWFEH